MSGAHVFHPSNDTAATLDGIDEAMRVPTAITITTVPLCPPCDDIAHAGGSWACCGGAGGGAHVDGRLIVDILHTLTPSVNGESPVEGRAQAGNFGVFS